MKSVQDIRVVQLIDSLEPGGAERMAVTIANTIGKELKFSGIVVTRLEGSLKETISSKVNYLFLRKKRAVDIYALLRFRKFLKKNRVTIIHAHGSSYFFAVLLKIILPSIKIFWHDHYGNRLKSTNSNNIIKLVSIFFSGVFTVNLELQKWALQNLKTSNVFFLPNYVEENPIEQKCTILKGEKGKRIVVLANLRTPKNHHLALSAFSKSKIASLGWTLHFIGKDNYDSYSKDLKDKITNDNLINSVFIYGSCLDVQHILNQCDVGLLTSTYEGFPVTLLEYGRANLFVIASNVGYCNQIIRNAETGICFELNKENELESILKSLAENVTENKILAQQLNDFVNENYSAKVVIKKILSIYQK